jgi:hypothetical protein
LPQEAGIFKLKKMNKNLSCRGGNQEKKGAHPYANPCAFGDTSTTLFFRAEAICFFS